MFYIRPYVSHLNVIKTLQLKKTQGGRGHWAIKYTSPQSFYNNIFIFVGLTTLGFLLNFDWLGQLVELGDVHQLIGYCLFPLDP